VQHAPAGGHAAGRDDHGRRARARQALRLGAGFDEAHAVGQGIDFTPRRREQLAMPQCHLGGRDRHRAVEEDRQRGRDVARALEPLQHQQQGLRATDRKGRQQHAAPALHGAADGIAQGAIWTSSLGWMRLP